MSKLRPVEPALCKYIRRGYTGGSIPLPADHPWQSAKPAGPVRRLSRREIEREYAGRMAALSDRRLAKEFAAYDKLDEINERWERRGRPKR